jgi:hypothetical protein
MDKNVEKFQYLLQKEKWDEVFASNEPNTSKNKNKALWKIINKVIGNSHHVSNIVINTGAKIITNPQRITERFNICLTEVTEDILSQVNYYCSQQYLQFQIKNRSKTMFVTPVTETEVEQVMKGLKNNLSPGFDEILISLVTS